MAMYSISIIFGNLECIKEVDATSLEEASTIAVELATTEFGSNLDGIRYDVREITNGKL